MAYEQHRENRNSCAVLTCGSCLTYRHAGKPQGQRTASLRSYRTVLVLTAWLGHPGKGVQHFLTCFPIRKGEIAMPACTPPMVVTRFNVDSQLQQGFETCQVLQTCYLAPAPYSKPDYTERSHWSQNKCFVASGILPVATCVTYLLASLEAEARECRQHVLSQQKGILAV